VRRSTLATLAIFLLALLFGWETRQALRATPGGQENAATAPVVAWRPGISAPDPASPPDPTPAAAVVTSRPLFRQDRQPFREAAAGVSVRNYEVELSRFTLLGVLGFGEKPYGVVVEKGGSKGERWEVKAGDALPGFTVKEVGVEGMLLTADGREFLLPLYAGPPTAAAGAVRTEIPRRDTASPAAAPGFPASAKPEAPGAPPGTAALPAPARPMPAVPSASPLSRRLRQPPPTSVAPGVPPVPSTPDTLPVVAPRYIPGRR